MRQKDGKRLAVSLMVDKGNPERAQIALYIRAAPLLWIDHQTEILAMSKR